MFVNTAEPKARSRISKTTKPETSEPVPTQRESPVSFRKIRDRSSSFAVPNFLKNTGNFLGNSYLSNDLGVRYIKALPWLGLSGIFFAGLFYVFTTVHPSAVANWLLYQSYFPILILFLCATFFLCRFIFLSPTKGLSLSIWLTVLLLLKFQSFVLTPALVAISAAIFVGIPFIWPVLFRR
jgi:hypothetical protein